MDGRSISAENEIFISQYVTTSQAPFSTSRGHCNFTLKASSIFVGDLYGHLREILIWWEEERDDTLSKFQYVKSVMIYKLRQPRRRNGNK